MEIAMNGSMPNGVSNGLIHTNGFHEPTEEELMRELPLVQDGQIPLGELVSRTAQAIYAELTELAETMPNMSDSARKRTLADWVVKTKKQVVKLYAVVKWSRDAEVVQKAMNVTAFLMDQNHQFEQAIYGVKYAKESLDPARLRNHDLLTSLDVLTTGSYRRLPTCIKKLVIPPTPLTDDEVAKTLRDVEDVIRYRIRMMEIVPPEITAYHIADGRIYFTAPKLFEMSLCVRGARQDDGWFFVNVEFLFEVGGDRTGMQEFPRQPTGLLKRHITDEADARLAFYLPLPPDPAIPAEVEVPPRPQLPEGVVDTPIVRVFNFLQMMSLSYQLEILWYQAERMRSLGWAEYLSVEMANGRKTLIVSYWIRRPPPPGRPPPQSRLKIPLLGGKLTISIVKSQMGSDSKPIRAPKDRVLAELQQRAKLGGKRPSDEVEIMKFDVKWEPEKGAIGVTIPIEEARRSLGELKVDPDNLDFEAMLRTVISRHTHSILSVFQRHLQHGPTRNTFSPPGEVTLVENGSLNALHVHLCADEVVVITIDPRTGRLTIRDTGDLAAAGRGPRFAAISDRLNESPTALGDVLDILRFSTMAEMAEQKANYLGLQSYRSRNFPPEEKAKLGPGARVLLYIQLAAFTEHYLVLVLTDEEFRYALISVEVSKQKEVNHFLMKDIGWIDVKRVHTDEHELALSFHPEQPSAASGGDARHLSRFRLETRVLRELYSYCCARVAHAKLEAQLKNRFIPYAFVTTTDISPSFATSQLPSSLSRSIPALCVQSSDILSGAPAAEAAMPNIRLIPLNWWSDQQAQVIICVKLKYVQQPVGKRAGSTVIRPSKRIIYDTREAIVSFLSEDINKCVDEFREEWARVSKMVVIAREVARLSREKAWSGVRLLSFDLQTVEFAYAADYSVSITYTSIDQLTPTEGSYDLRFSRVADDMQTFGADQDQARYNPHDDVEPFLRNILQHGQLASSLHRLVALLRDTLPIVVELENIRRDVALRKQRVDTFAKAASWFRILYDDAKHALDFRLMTDSRVLVVDASHSLFRGDGAADDARGQDDALLLQPIPDFPAMLSAAVNDAQTKNAAGRVISIDIGAICGVSAVGALGRALHDSVMQRLGAAT